MYAGVCPCIHPSVTYVICACIPMPPQYHPVLHFEVLRALKVRAHAGSPHKLGIWESRRLTHLRRRSTLVVQRWGLKQGSVFLLPSVSFPTSLSLSLSLTSAETKTRPKLQSLGCGASLGLRASGVEFKSRKMEAYIAV